MCDSGGPVEKKVLCVKESRPEIGGKDYCVWPLSLVSLKDLFDGAELGEKIQFELCEMTEAELEDLPEFEGW